MPILQDDTTFTSATLGEFHLSILRGEGIIELIDLFQLASPWAHRTLIVRKLKGLEDFFGKHSQSLAQHLHP